jgi:BolA protein
MKKFLKFIEDKIKNNLDIEKIRVIDNTHKHKSHKSFDVDKYHLSLEIESKYLKNMNKLESQRKIMQILNKELKTKIHALEIKIR